MCVSIKYEVIQVHTAVCGLCVCVCGPEYTCTSVYFCLCLMCLAVATVVLWQVSVCDLSSTLTHHRDRPALCEPPVSHFCFHFIPLLLSLCLSFTTSAPPLPPLPVRPAGVRC